MEGLVLLLVFGGIAFAIANFLGKKRQIGFGWSFFFCLFLSPIGGFITTMLSRKYYDENPQPSQTKKVIGWILIVLFGLSLLGNFIALGKVPPERMASQLNALFLAVGFIGLGFYLIELGKGKNFNTEALTKTDD
ncbi:MAG: hypothetical protein ACK4Q5_11045 [Saprospiraceae bacterium]